MSELKGTVATKGAVNGKIATVYGKDGDSAYEVAVANGFEGTEEEWLESLKIMPDVDQTYNSASDNPQSGIAISEAFAMAAINGTASGTEVCITDVSPLEHNINVKVDNADATVIRTGKNLLNQSQYGNYNNKGLSITYDSNDDSYTIDGQITSTLNTDIPLNPFIAVENDEKVKYAFLIEHIGGNIEYLSAQSVYAKVILRATDTPDGSSLSNGFEPKNMQENDMVVAKSLNKKYISHIRFHITPNVKFTDFKIRLQLEKGDFATDFESYVAPTEHTPDADGNVLVPSVYPTTVLTTDTEGVSIEAEYNVDTKAYIDNKFAELQALVLEG